MWKAYFPPFLQRMHDIFYLKVPLLKLILFIVCYLKPQGNIYIFKEFKYIIKDLHYQNMFYIYVYKTRILHVILIFLGSPFFIYIAKKMKALKVNCPYSE